MSDNKKINTRAQVPGCCVTWHKPLLGLTDPPGGTRVLALVAAAGTIFSSYG
jgi:hypothetical protein